MAAPPKSESQETKSTVQAGANEGWSACLSVFQSVSESGASLAKTVA